MGVSASETSIRVPGRDTLKNGAKCDGKKGKVQTRVWESKTDTSPETLSGDPRDVSSKNGELITVAFVPEGADIPMPPSRQLDRRPSDLAQPRTGPAGERNGHSNRRRATRHTDHRRAVVRGLVLVGGEGTRLRPLTLTTPKQMLPVAGAPMIEHVLHHLHGHGIDHVVLAMGYRPDAFIDAYPDGVCAGVRVEYAVEAEPLDTAGAILFAARQAGLDGEFVVVNGDVITGIDIGALVAFHRERGAQATIALTPVDDPSRFGVVPTDDEGRVVAFIEKPPAGEAPTNLINAGHLRARPLGARLHPRGPARVDRARDVPALVAAGGLYAMASDATGSTSARRPRTSTPISNCPGPGPTARCWPMTYASTTAPASAVRWCSRAR